MSRSLADGVTLVLGGVRSGKSVFAETLVEESGGAPVYIATGRAWDDEMLTRIDAHRQRRGEAWTTVEEPLDLAAAIDTHSGAGRVVLVDCLTLWLTNLMIEDRDVGAECDGLLAVLAEREADRIVLVSNEVGLGLIGENRMARDFADHAGTLHRRIADVAGTVHLVVAGLPLTLKG